MVSVTRFLPSRRLTPLVGMVILAAACGVPTSAPRNQSSGGPEAGSGGMQPGGSPGTGGLPGTGGAGGSGRVGGSGGPGGTGGSPGAPDAGGPSADARLATLDGGTPAPDARPGPADAGPPNKDPACARMVRAASLVELSAAIAGAQPGDCVVLAAGSYTSTGPISVNRAGTAGQRITIMAEGTGAATIGGMGGFLVEAPAAYVTIRGFRFTHQGGMKVAAGTKNCLVTRNTFTIAGDGAYLRVAGEDSEVSYNLFENKSTVGSFLALDEDPITLRPHAHHNHFRGHTFTGSNGGEAMQIFSTLPRVEHNLFEEIHVAGEMVSVKEGGGSMGGFYRFNTFRNCTRGSFTLRYARRDVVEGNFFLSTPGVRVYGRDHKIINNYLQGGTLTLGDGVDNTYPPIDNVEVAFNTLVNARIAGQDRGAGASPPQNLRIISNIIQADSGVAVSQRTAWVNPTYAGNILWGAASPGDLPAAGFRRVDPRLVGGYKLQVGSPAIDGAVASSSVTDDIEGQPRVMPDVGADEFSAAPATRRPLTAADVGPLAQ